MKQIFRHIVSTGLIALAIPAAQGQAISHQAPEPAADQQNVVLLGSGWDTHSESVRGYCVRNADDQVYYAGTQSSTIFFDRSMTEDQLETELDVNVSGKLKLPVFSVKGASKFLTSAKATDLSQTLVFSNIIRGKSALIRSTALTETGTKIAQKADNEQYVRSNCGDSFVSEIELGAKLFVGVKFEFSSREAKSSFEANIDVDYLKIFEVKGAAKTALEQFKKQLKIKIFLFQQGGRPQLASDILNDAGGNGSSIITCSIENRASCVKALGNLVNYISGDEPTSFKNQVKDFVYDPTSPGGPAFLTHKTRSYYEAGHHDLYPVQGPIIKRAILDARRELIFAYDKQSRHHLKAVSLLSMRLSESERQSIMATRDILKTNISQILDTAKVCYDTPNLCIETYKTLELKDYDPTTLVHVNTFIDYCESPGFSKRYKTTVDAIRKAIDGVDLTCERALETIKSYKALRMPKSKPPIKDLSPLKGLEHLTLLDLEGNEVGVTTPLAKFTNLKTLYLRDNNVPDLSPLSKLPNLEYLDASGNRFEDVEGFENNTSLVTLLLFNNVTVIDPKPLASIPTLETLIYSKRVRCDEEVERVVAAGMISKEKGVKLMEAGFAPSYKIAGDIKSGLKDFYRCGLVFHEYDPGADRL